MFVTQLCPTLCDPMDCSPPSFSVHGILQARILEWVAISLIGFLGTHVCSVVSDSVTPRTAAHHASLSMGFSRQEYWSGLPRPPPGDLPDPGIKPMSPASPALQGDSLPTESPGKPSGPYILCKLDCPYAWACGTGSSSSVEFSQYLGHLDHSYSDITVS